MNTKFDEKMKSMESTKIKEIKKVLVIGSGPIVIGQAAEFDYSGTQACLALKEEGVEVVLMNSNPATIMTDDEIADRVYIEPLQLEMAIKIIQKENPDAILANVGGQTALNLAIELEASGILEANHIDVLGTSIESIKKGEDRLIFRELMKEIGQPVIESQLVTNIEDGEKYASRIGYPVVLRPAYTLGGSGGGIAYDCQSLKDILQKGLQLSKTTEVLIEKSIKGYKEIEYEVMRDKDGNKISVCNMENIDPVGIHTGDSIVVAPSQTLSDKAYQMLRKASLDIIEEVGIIGGCNVQLALNPNNFEYVVIEINPRVSRSSALASKATGYPIAKIATKLALGYRLDEILNEVTGKTYACFEPSLDYVVTKIPKWPFDKFHKANRKLGTKMMATGEVMAIGNNFYASFLKAIRSLEMNRYTLYSKDKIALSLQELKDRMIMPDDERIFDIAELIRRNYRLDMISRLTGIDLFFLSKMKDIIQIESDLKANGIEMLNKEMLMKIKGMGFSDKGIGLLIDESEEMIRQLRKVYGIVPGFRMVDTCAGEFEAVSPYYYSSYKVENESINQSKKKKIIVLGSGPIRIGQGIEFDYCSVHCVMSLKKLGYETIIINNNPETVSTDFSIADKLYFEPITKEEVMNIIELEQPEGIILQFGGQTAIKLSSELAKEGVRIIGTSAESVDIAEDRKRFEQILSKNHIYQPKGETVLSIGEGMEKAKQIGFPVVIRPSYVLGGQGMEIVNDENQCYEYLSYVFDDDSDKPVLIDQYIEGIEIEVDAICDGESVFIPGIMEHIEASGVHSGDSMSIYPTRSLSQTMKNQIVKETNKIAKALDILGLMNIQFIVQDDQLYMIEVNPRSSRTVPYISKVTNIPMVDIAVQVMMGENLIELGYKPGLHKEVDYYTVKAPVFSTEKLSNVDTILGPEMKSTGEVLGIDKDYNYAIYKAFLGAGLPMILKKKAMLITISKDKIEKYIPLLKALYNKQYTLYTTEGTYYALLKEGLKTNLVHETLDDKPNVMTMINQRDVDIILNIPSKNHKKWKAHFDIRRHAAENDIATFTALDSFESYCRLLLLEIDQKSIEPVCIQQINV